MSWIIQEESSQEELANQFRDLMYAKTVFKIPGTHDGMAALLAKKTGFKAIYLSGAAYTASRGLPDIGLINSEEVAGRARDLIRVTNLPLLADIDTGFGGVLSVARTAKEMVEARVAAVQLEDQDLPKKCGHLNGKNLISAIEMAQKIEIIKKVAPTLLVIARTDAMNVNGLDDAIYRAKMYRDAGADAIFPEALTDEQEFRHFSQTVDIPLLANMTEFGRTPYYTADQFKEWGFQIVLYPVSSLRIAAKSIERLFEEIAEKGTQSNLLGDMQTRQELYETIRYYDYEDMDHNIAKTILPNTEQNKED
jgi:methylisocitrate lyase